MTQSVDSLKNRNVFALDAEMVFYDSFITFGAIKNRANFSAGWIKTCIRHTKLSTGCSAKNFRSHVLTEDT